MLLCSAIETYLTGVPNADATISRMAACTTASPMASPHSRSKEVTSKCSFFQETRQPAGDYVLEMRQVGRNVKRKAVAGDPPLQGWTESGQFAAFNADPRFASAPLGSDSKF